ncbi:MAG: cell division protein FtsZ, partial [Thermoplasmata archaeon]
AENAVNQAIKSPLLDVDIKDATGALVQVVGGPDMTLAEASKVVEILGSKINPMARIIWGAAIDPTMEHTITVLLVIVGVKYNTKREALQRAARREPAIEVIEKDDDIGIDFIRK